MTMQTKNWLNSRTSRIASARRVTDGTQSARFSFKIKKSLICIVYKNIIDNSFFEVYIDFDEPKLKEKFRQK